MFSTVQTHLHPTNQKLEGNVWEIYLRSLQILKYTCSVFLQISVIEMIYTVQTQMHDRNQKL